MSSERKIPRVLTKEERQDLLTKPNKRYPTGLRNYCILKAMVDLGLRCCEVIDLKTRDIDFRIGSLTVKGKGKRDKNGNRKGKERIVYANGKLVGYLEKWLAIKPDSNGLFFCTLKGESIKSSYLRMMVDRYAKKAGIVERRIYPHLLRHTAGTDFYRRTKDIRLTQEMLGHASISSTQIYTHIVNDELEDAMKALRENED